MKLIFILCLLAGALAVMPSAGDKPASRTDWLVLGGLHAAMLGWGWLMFWQTGKHGVFFRTSRKAWLIGMALAYLVGVGGGVYVFVLTG